MSQVNTDDFKVSKKAPLTKSTGLFSPNPAEFY